jgi:RNA binding exosome subunit
MLMETLIRTIIRPNKQKITLELPEGYIGKKVEIIAFTIHDSEENDSFSDKIETHYVSESTLAKDWLTSEEDKAWGNL